MKESKYDILKIKIPNDYDYENEHRVLYRFKKGKCQFFMYSMEENQDESEGKTYFEFTLNTGIVGEIDCLTWGSFDSREKRLFEVKKIAAEYTHLLKPAFFVQLKIKSHKDTTLKDSQMQIRFPCTFQTLLHGPLINMVKYCGIGEIPDDTDYIQVDYEKNEVRVNFKLYDKDLFKTDCLDIYLENKLKCEVKITELKISNY